MLNVIECVKNNQILSEIFGLILNLQENEPETTKKHIPDKLIVLLTYLSNSCNTKSAIANPLEIVFLACQELCQVNPLGLLEIPYLSILLQSELIQILNKFNQFQLLDIETFSVIINEPEVGNIDQIIIVLSQNGYHVSKELIFDIARILRKFPEEQATTSQDLLSCITSLKNLGLLDLKSMELFEEIPLAHARFIIDYLTEVKILNKLQGKCYLEQALDKNIANYFFEIIHSCNDVFENNLQNKQAFLLSILNHVSFGTDFLQCFVECIRKFATQNALNQIVLRTYVGFSFSVIKEIHPEFIELMYEMNKFPSQTFLTIMRAFQNAIFKPEHSKKLIAFILQIQTILNNPNKDIIEKYIQMGVHEVDAKKCLAHFSADAKYSELKQKILLMDSWGMKHIIESIEKLESCELLQYLANPAQLEQLSKFCQSHYLDSGLKLIAIALETLRQSGLIHSKKTFESFMTLLVKGLVPIELAQVFVSQSQEPVRFCDTDRSIIANKLFLKHDSPKTSLMFARKLESLNLLTLEAFKKFTSKNSEIFKVLSLMLEDGKFDAEEIRIILPHILSENERNPYNYISGFILLKQHHLLSESFKTHYLLRVIEHTNPYDLCQALVLLEQSPLSDEKKQEYREICFSQGIQIICVPKTPTTKSPEELYRFKKSYLVHFRNIYLIIDGELTFLQRLEKDRFKLLNELIDAAKLTSDTFLLTDEFLKNFLDITNTQPRFNSCVNYVKAMLEIEEKLRLMPWFHQSHIQQLVLHPNPYETAQTLSLMQTFGLFTEAHAVFIDAAISHPHPLSLAQALNYIQNSKLLSFEEPILKHILKHKKPLEFSRAICDLKQHNLFAHPAFEAIIDSFIAYPDPINFAKCLVLLHQENLFEKSLSSKNFKSFFKLEEFDMTLIAKVCIALNLTLGLNEESIEQYKKMLKTILSDHDKIKTLNRILELGFHDDILQIIETILQTQRPYLSEATKQEVSILLQSETCLLFKHEILKNFLNLSSYRENHFFKNIKFLTDNKLLTEETSKFLLNCSVVKNTAIFENLQRAELDIPDCIQKMQQSTFIIECLSTYNSEFKYQSNLSKHLNNILKLLFIDEVTYPSPRTFLSLLSYLVDFNLFNIGNIKHVLNFGSYAANVFCSLGRLRIFSNYDNFLFYIQFHLLFDSPILQDTINLIPFNGLSLEQFNVIKTICFRHLHLNTHPSQDIQDFIRHSVLGIPRANTININANVFNSRQSTHTKTVHESVSVSISKLAHRYQELSSEEQQKTNLDEIIAFIHSLESNFSNDAAKRYLNLMIQNPLFLDYIDPKSNVNIKKLLHLFWIAIQDLEVRTFDPDDSPEEVIQNGKLLLVQAFYDAQRDGNINSDGIDDQLPVDKLPSCPSGFVNKLIEKLVGVHPDAEVKIICLEVANEKIKAIVCEKAINTTRLKIQAAKEQGEILPDDEIADAVTKTWESIKNEVGEVFFEEFKTLFDNQKDSPKFLGLLEAGQYAELSARQVEQLRKLNQQESKKRHADETEEGACEATQASTSQLGFFQHSGVKPMEEEPDVDDLEEEKRPVC